MSDNRKSAVRVGITHGDFNGIGYEVIIKTFMDHGMLELCTPVVYGIHKAATAYRKLSDAGEFSFYGVPDASKAVKHHCNFVNLTEVDVGLDPGKPTPASGAWAVKALQVAMEDLEKGKIDVLVTAPIDKHNVQGPDFKFPGHTEFLAEKTGTSSYLMLLISENLRIGTVTGHIPVKDVAQTITQDLIIEKLNVFNRSLREDFGIVKPRIAVLGLNPHAGDGGLLGKEELDVILPAVRKAKEAGLLCFGPYPADGFFGNGTWKEFDGVLAMYHDQGLIPFKSIAFHEGVNFTAGLPIIRTSPDHGTAFDITGKNIAREDSFRAAVFQAIDIYRHRKLNSEITANPLPFNPKKDRERERFA
ncbi:MAG: 4-hydroxythreonine-4-phosphate dehydrogenase PdxA [Bacteroidetes bacterium]|nr:4-hydroxythreonine-4-phosphate dehydrogenase PdxA [Bacteroidota bacterium]